MRYWTAWAREQQGSAKVVKCRRQEIQHDPRKFVCSGRERHGVSRRKTIHYVGRRGQVVWFGVSHICSRGVVQKLLVVMSLKGAVCILCLLFFQSVERNSHVSCHPHAHYIRLFCNSFPKLITCFGIVSIDEGSKLQCCWLRPMIVKRVGFDRT
jgi:hypothetical protein